MKNIDKSLYSDTLNQPWTESLYSNTLNQPCPQCCITTGDEAIGLLLKTQITNVDKFVISSIENNTVMYNIMYR
jgi:hypothetical protein